MKKTSKKNKKSNKTAEKRAPRYYESELLRGYEEVYRINATDKKTGIILNAIALAVMAAVFVLALVPMGFNFDYVLLEGTVSTVISLLVFLAAMVGYMVLHELCHGAVYKLLTKQKLSFGLSWSCAFCGVPDVYTYRRTAILALAAPLVLLGILLAVLCGVMYDISHLMYLLSALLLAFHLGGCVGDMYLLMLLFTKYRQKHLLMRDTGAEQYLYLPKDEAGEK